MKISTAKLELSYPNRDQQCDKSSKATSSKHTKRKGKASSATSSMHAPWGAAEPVEEEVEESGRSRLALIQVLRSLGGGFLLDVGSSGHVYCLVELDMTHVLDASEEFDLN